MRTLTLFILLLLTHTACQRFVYKDYNIKKAKQRYELSLQNTSVPEDEPIAYNLLSPSLDSNRLAWKQIGGKNYLLVVMWKKESDLKYYANDCNTGFYNTRNRYNFVTLVPQLKDACRKKTFGTGNGVNLRLEELLGLPQQSDKTFFVEAWVQPEDLIRPCRDRETNDRNCSLTMGDTTNQSYLTYLNWLKTGNAGYPFTQLGYTYDWKKKNGKHEGMSEFLIDQQSDIVIHSFIATSDYCFVPGARKLN